MHKLHKNCNIISKNCSCIFTFPAAVVTFSKCFLILDQWYSNNHLIKLLQVVHCWCKHFILLLASYDALGWKTKLEKEDGVEEERRAKRPGDRTNEDTLLTGYSSALSRRETPALKSAKWEDICRERATLASPGRTEMNSSSTSFDFCSKIKSTELWHEDECSRRSFSLPSLSPFFLCCHPSVYITILALFRLFTPFSSRSSLFLSLFTTSFPL